MITCHCPHCNITFRHEDAEVVFCPKCETVLCEIAKCENEAIDTDNIPLVKKDILPIIRIVIGVLVCFQCIALLSILLFKNNRPIEPISLILIYPTWCVFSYTLFRFFIKEYSARSGIVSLAFWLLTLSAYFVIAALVASKWNLLSEMLSWKTLLSALPGAFIAYKLGSTKHFFRKLFMPFDAGD